LLKITITFTHLILLARLFFLKKIFLYKIFSLVYKIPFCVNVAWVCIIILFTNNKCIAQAINFETLTSKDGLSQNMVYDVVEDAQGYLWVATKDGLNRYDGNNVKTFTHNIYNKYSLSGNMCTSLLLDTKGRLWIGTESDGINLYDAKTERFYKARLKDDSITKDGNYPVLYFKEDKVGNIWILSEKNYRVFKITMTQKWPATVNFSECVKATNEWDYPQLKNIVINQQSYNCDWVNRNIVFKRLVFETQKINTNFQKVLYDTDGIIWLTYHDCIAFIKNNKIETIKYNNNGGLVTINYLQDSSIAICNQKHIWKMKPGELAQQKKLDSANAFVTLPSELMGINQIIQDRNSNLWVSTAGYGLFKIGANFKKFQSTLSGLSISNIYADNNNKIFLKGFANPLPFYHSYNETTKNLKLLPFAKRGYPQKNLKQDANNNYWMIKSINNSNRIDILQFNNQFKQVATYSIASKGSDFDVPVGMLIDGDRLWIGNVDGELIQFNILTHKAKYYYYTNLIQKKGIQYGVLNIFKDAQQVLWICTQNGLLKFNYAAAQPIFKMYKNSSDNKNSLSNNYTSCSVDDVYDKNILWGSTKSGLERLNKTTDVFKHYTNNEGLPNNVVYGILIGADSNYWVSTNKGIARLNSRTLKFTNYNKKDGLQDEEFNTNSYCKCKDGNLIFGGINGITKYDPCTLFKNKNTSILHIVDFKINNQSINVSNDGKILNANINYLDALDLQYNQNQLSFELAILDFTNPSKNIFKYQLVGIDNDWTTAGTNRFANYAQLPPGNYTFKAMGSADGETWSTVKEISIKIHPPWYRTWLAYFVYAIFIIGLLYYLYNNKINKVRLQEQVVFKEKEAQQLAELNQIKTNFFSNISHEIRTPLTLILAPSEMLATQQPNEPLQQLIFRNAKRLLELVNQILDISKLEAGQMAVSLQQKELVSFFNNCFFNFENMALSKNIKYAINQNKQEVWGYIDEDKMNKIMNNVLSNAIKFTNNNGQIHLDITYNTTIKTYIIAVADNGIGIAANKLDEVFNKYFQGIKSDKRKYEGTGLGMALTKELVTILHGNITVKSAINEGTTFIISLPIIENN
jgi:signal transduction histidine kinase/ligand-binding sensor domain-containing protein